jgi:2-phospho-L-lactate/phosphoenolpyruvate guanylyltransferase
LGVRTAAILPVKRFSRAKQRLSTSVTDPLREQLAGAMVADVLLALSQTESIERTILVTREPAVADLAREHGAVLLEDEAESGQPAAAALGVRFALAEGFARVLCIPGDCPALDPAELGALLAADAGTGRGERAVVIVPDRHGTGTNGLLLRPPDAIAPAFGPGSCERHRALALAAGVDCRVERPPSLLLDVDNGADLAVLRRRLIGDRPAGESARAERTRAVLGEGEHPDVLSITTPA